MNPKARDIAHLHRLSFCSLASIGSTSVDHPRVDDSLQATLAPPSSPPWAVISGSVPSHVLDRRRGLVAIHLSPFFWRLPSPFLHHFPSPSLHHLHSLLPSLLLSFFCVSSTHCYTSSSLVLLNYVDNLILSSVLHPVTKL